MARSPATMLVVVERNMRVSWISAASERLTGWRPSDLWDRPLESLQHRFGWNLDLGEVARTLSEGTEWSQDLCLRTRGGELLRICVEVLALRGDDDELIGALLVARDDTELQRLRSVAEAVNLATNAGQMFAGIRHELGNPINSIKTALTVLRMNWQHFDASHVDHYFERMLVEVGRVEYLLRSLRSFSAFENLQLRQVSLGAALTEIVRISVRTAHSLGVNIHLEDPQGLSVVADERALYQIFLNLVTNALDAVEQTRGRVSLRARRIPGRKIAVEVVDDGPGIPSDQLTAVRRPFFTTKAHGTGLGLTIVDRLVAEMSAGFEIESRPGHTVMRVVLTEAGEHV